MYASVYLCLCIVWTWVVMHLFRCLAHTKMQRSDQDVGNAFHIGTLRQGFSLHFGASSFFYPGLVASKLQWFSYLHIHKVGVTSTHDHTQVLLTLGTQSSVLTHVHQALLPTEQHSPDYVQTKCLVIFFPLYFITFLSYSFITDIQKLVVSSFTNVPLHL